MVAAKRKSCDATDKVDSANRHAKAASLSFVGIHSPWQGFTSITCHAPRNTKNAARSSGHKSNQLIYDVVLYYQRHRGARERAEVH